MSARRRPGSWQDEVAKGFSRLFSRSSSQEKEEEAGGEEQEKGDRSLSRFFFRNSPQEKSDKGPQEEQERSPSRLFLKRANQDNKGAEHGAARGPQEEQERTRGFSRLFSRTSSQEKQDEDHTKGNPGEEDHDRHEEKNSNLSSDVDERLSSSETEQVKEDQNSSPPRQVTSESEEEKDYRQNSKALDSEKQSRENFLHFIGNLFNFSPKTSLGNAKQVDSTQDLCKEHEDSQAKNIQDKEDSHQEHTQDVSTSETEQTAEFSSAQTKPSAESNTEAPKETIKPEQQDTPTSVPKLNDSPQEAPAVTYGTYRGSRRIRKLLKRRADVNSPIPEKEETSEKETSSTGHVGLEMCHMLHEIVNMEPISYRSSEEEMPPPKIQIKMKMQPKIQNSSQNGEFNSQEVKVLKQNAEDYSKDSFPSQNVESNIHEIEKQNADVSSLVSVPIYEGESNSHRAEDLNQKPEAIFFVSAPNQNDKSFSHEAEDLKHNAEVNPAVSRSQKPNSIDSLTISEDMKQSSEKSLNLSDKVQLHAEKTSDVHTLPDNTDSSEISMDFQPNISEDLHSKAEDKSRGSVDLVSTELIKTSGDLPLNNEKSSNISGNPHVNAKTSSEDLQSKSDSDSHLSLDLSSLNEDSLNISVSHTNLENSSKMLERQQPNNLQENSVEAFLISGDVLKKEEISNISKGPQKNSEAASKILESLNPNKNGSPKCLCELKQDFEKNAEPAEENNMDIQPIPAENTESVKTSENDFPNNVYLYTKENVENGRNQQLNFEKSTTISSDPHLTEIELAVTSQESTSIAAADLLTNNVMEKVLREHQSEPISNKEYSENIQENLDRFKNFIDVVSESSVNTERLLASDGGATQETAFNARINLNHQKLINEDMQLVEKEELQDNSNISEKLKPNVEEIPKMSSDLQPYRNMHTNIEKDLQQFADDNCQL
ncbi:uncharacterized protein [Pyxicephalus adspersus]|uniref:uncharacterized protein n=1 Tax=Pyxicephalus adspersus TaxID=30357 RepID=UPI003B5C9FD7